MLPKPALLRVLAVSMYFIGTIPDNGTTQPALYRPPHCTYMCLIPYILAPVYTFRCIFDVSAGLWKEEKVYSITVGFSPTLYC